MTNKNITVHSILLLVLGFTFVAAVQAQQINFHISGIDITKGKLYIQLFQGEDNYKKGIAETSTIITVKSDSAKVNFDNVLPGEYAVRFFQDENADGKLDTNMFGLPTEGYGFSNNAKPNFGPVSFKKAKFDVLVDQPEVTNSTQIIY